MADQKPQEVVEIEAAAERCDDIYWWKKRLGITAWVIYGVGGILWILNRPGAPLILIMGFVLLAFNMTYMEIQLLKRRYFMQKLVNAFNRSRAVPFYQELQMKFADQPNLHIHLAEDGTIQITDRGKKEIQK